MNLIFFLFRAFLLKYIVPFFRTKRVEIIWESEHFIKLVADTYKAFFILTSDFAQTFIMTDIEKNDSESTPVKEGVKEIKDIHADDIPEEATWNEVFQTCCCHGPKEWGLIVIGVSIVLFFLYFFLFGLDLLGSGAKVMGGCTAGELFGDNTNPVAGLMVGILATVFLQSSSTTTSIVVSLVGANTVSVNQGIYMIMGANIGTSVTNTIVAMGQMGDGDQLERAFAGATVHDMFNFLTVAIFFPVELITGYLNRLTAACVKNFTAREGEKWVGPIKKFVSPLTKKVIIANKNVIKGVAKGQSCSDFYPIECEDPEFPTKSTCSKVGLIACDKVTDECPAFFQVDASRNDDKFSGIAVFVLGLVIMFICLFAMVTMLQKLFLETSTRVIYKATNINGYLAILVGTGITILVQSSSITTSTFTPLVGLGVIRLEQMFPITLGANIGTTITSLLAALLSTTDALQVALAHLFFNISGIIVWYPVPFMREIPLNAARNLGKSTRIWRGFPIVYILVCFLLIPFILLGLSLLFTQGGKGLTALGSMMTVSLIIGLVYSIYWFQMANGKQRIINNMEVMQARRAALRTLPEDMEFLKSNIKQPEENSGLLADGNDDDVEPKEIDA
jgi:sodium-dependent phosphate cotransporter